MSSNKKAVGKIEGGPVLPDRAVSLRRGERAKYMPMRVKNYE
ncbi:hypothetical protein [Thermoanaerobacterium sp. DL9XJH110]